MTKFTKIFLGAIFTICALTLFVSVFVHAAWQSPKDDVTLPPQAVSQAQGPFDSLATNTSPAAPNTGGGGATASRDDWPSRLVIPALSIDANVQYVGKGKSGSMAVPSNYSDVAWYRYGAIPGMRGSAVMDGHVDNGFGLPGVFKNLADIKIGDDIYVKNNAGEQVHFKVDQVNIYDYKSVPLETIFDMNDRPRLNLITCEGVWILGAKTYDKRLVVSAVLASS